jgi:hypothetical protein
MDSRHSCGYESAFILVFGVLHIQKKICEIVLDFCVIRLELFQSC